MHRGSEQLLPFFLLDAASMHEYNSRKRTLAQRQGDPSREMKVLMQRTFECDWLRRTGDTRRGKDQNVEEKGGAGKIRCRLFFLPSGVSARWPFSTFSWIL
jgi:hypothetical protein